MSCVCVRAHMSTWTHHDDASACSRGDDVNKNVGEQS